MKNKHTPGPWKLSGRIVDKELCNYTATITDKDGNEIVNCIGKQSHNARLIAAAPEMYEALKEFLECGINAGSNMELIKQVKDAIAKAGEK